MLGYLTSIRVQSAGLDMTIPKSLLTVIEKKGGDDGASSESTLDEINEGLGHAEDIEQRIYNSRLSAAEDAARNWGDSAKITEYYDNQMSLTYEVSGPTHYERDVVRYDKPRLLKVPAKGASKAGRLVYDALTLVLMADEVADGFEEDGDDICVVLSRHHLPISASVLRRDDAPAKRKRSDQDGPSTSS